MDLTEFDYHLPPERIAQEPLADRSASRMLVVYREKGCWEDRMFRDFPDFLKPDDCVVLNDTRVIPARLFGRREGMRGRVEVLLIEPVSGRLNTWRALVRPGRKMRTGERVHFEGGLEAVITGRGDFGERTLRFECQGDFLAILDQIGHVPLPPYIRRADAAADRERYQTVYARRPGSAAAPTAGLHFTPEILARCPQVAYITLHVGLGTFQPLHTEVVEQARLHPEFYTMAEAEARKLRAAHRLVAVGTTVVRTLETAMLRGEFQATGGETDLFIYPGFQFRATQAMLTNFHLPRSYLFTA